MNEKRNRGHKVLKEWGVFTLFAGVGEGEGDLESSGRWVLLDYVRRNPRG